MYAVSDAYKAAMKQPVQRFRMRGTIGETAFTEDNILQGSFSITNQCCGSDNIEIGQVYIGELDATFMNVPLDRYQWKNKLITPVFGMRLADGTYEDVPLGVFTIDSASWTRSGVVVKAYDNMSKLDKECRKILTGVTPYEAAKAIERETGVVFGNTEDEMKAFANGTITLSETEANDVETWRDLTAWLAQSIGCFATADRHGRIVFRAYGETPVDTIDPSHRFTGCSFSDFETRFTGLSVVNMEDSTTSYYSVEPDDGLTMNLGSNPFLQFGTEDIRKMERTAILTALQKVHYVPFKASAIGNPAYDLGDVLVFSDGLADGSKLYCITQYVFRYGGTYEMTGVGANPALASARSKTDKDLAGLIANTDQNTIVHYYFHNTNAVEVGDGKKETIASIKFATATKKSEVSLWLELLMRVKKTIKEKAGKTAIDSVIVSSPPTTAELQKEITADEAAITDLDKRTTVLETGRYSPPACTAKVYYYLEGSEIDYHPEETYTEDGLHTMGLHYFIGTVQENKAYTFTVMVEANGGSVSFDPESIHAVIEGMGLAGTGKWDGTITVEDKFAALSFAGMIGKMNDAASTGFITPSPTVGFSDSVSFTFAPMLGAFTDSVETAIVVRYFILSDSEGEPEYSSTYVAINSEDAFLLNQDYSCQAKEGTVDDGYLQVLELFADYPELITLESMEIV